MNNLQSSIDNLQSLWLVRPKIEMNLAVVTTLGVNAGDNFIYEGFKHIFPARHYGSVFLINKTAIPKQNDYRKFIDEADVVVICGSPIFYPGCYKMRWQNKLLQYCEQTGKKIMLCAVGSNFDCTVEGTVRIPSGNKYKDIVSRYNLMLWGDFTVREHHCLDFLKSLGFSNVSQIACPSLFASEIVSDNNRDLIFIIWGDTHWRAPLKPPGVFNICREMQKFFEAEFRNKKTVWICHDILSYQRLVQKIDRRSVLFSTNYSDFLKYYSRCYFAFSIKVHGAMLLSSMGIPSLLLQLDSRAATVEALGDEFATLSTEIDCLIETCIQKVKKRDDYRDKIKMLKEKYRNDYDRVFSHLDEG